ncbi:YbaB/EbfC family nucleoid-associated protein [Umezawaea sp. Da 62-37]|uniref:YbaB/EbfC family nucleoid-associated protein n=1 Tax=Umezawaea sp. Da 62-37 TaxID=3075927 RepID=UPI0028F714D8|nr:YbaB/EbfC family nucleoid-associated protein [Umezawaea sp. Da 62-37]WNV91899.1 YbaB/EbfC family nucleoid-associated protein [Umezawaea sp. Da 62-37]
MDQAEQRRQASERLAEVLARSTGTAEHPSGLAVVTATATGDLVGLRLHPAALSHGPDAVGRLVVDTARLATDAAVQRGYNELAKSLGDSMAIAIEGFAGPPPFRAAADAAARPPQPQAPMPQHPQQSVLQPVDRPPHGATIQAPPEPEPARPPAARPFAPTPPPAAQPARRLRPPVDDDEDAYFADPFGTGGSRR